VLAALLYAVFFKLQGGRRSEVLVIPEYGANTRS
jgi:hypothetical protein